MIGSRRGCSPAHVGVLMWSINAAFKCAQRVVSVLNCQLHFDIDVSVDEKFEKLLCIRQAV